MSSVDAILLHLSLIKQVGPSLVGRLLSAVGPDQLHELYGWSVSDFVERASVHQKYAEMIAAGLADETLLERECEQIDRVGATWVSLAHDRYPELLRHIYCPPVGLYVRGELDVLTRQAIAIVGSRDARDYAERVTQLLVPALVEHGFVVVSGGARGVDTMAHVAVCDVGGQTIVVQGPGLLHPYPASNRKLFERVLEHGGAVVSMFPMATDPIAHLFPARNRVIAGVARGTVVVQAASKSGAKITAALALQEGRDVFAVPGSLFDPFSAGCHELLAQGAIMTRCAEDILLQYGFIESSAGADHQTGVKEQQKSLFESAESSGFAHQLAALCREPISFDELIERSGMSFEQLQDELFSLQCAGIVQQNFMGLWERS